jgi:hypothetical protein
MPGWLKSVLIFGVVFVAFAVLRELGLAPSSFK